MSKGTDHERASENDHLDDLVRTIVETDELIFSAIGHAPAPVIVYDAYPEGGITGERVGTLASFLPQTPQVVESETLRNLRAGRECYAVWKKGVTRKISFIGRHPRFSGLGDHALKELWFLTALSLVRARVLFRSGWFPHAGIRTIESMVRHIRYFGDNGFLELRQLPNILATELSVVTPRELDMQLTQRLVHAAIENGTSREQALLLLLTN